MSLEYILYILTDLADEISCEGHFFKIRLQQKYSQHFFQINQLQTHLLLVSSKYQMSSADVISHQLSVVIKLSRFTLQIPFKNNSLKLKVSTTNVK